MNRQNASIITGLRAALGADSNGESDSDLLGKFLTNRDQSAFELLVWRHMDSVLRVCRSVLHDHHSAEDAAQAVFFILAKKGGSLTNRHALHGWLHQTAYRVSLRAAAHKKRVGGKSLEQVDALADSWAPNPPGDGSGDTEVVLHEEIARMPEKYRVPILLCYFEGMTHVEAARRLGLPVGSLASRVLKAKSLLQRAMERRGVLMPAIGAFTIALSRNASATGAGKTLFVEQTSREALVLLSGVHRTVKTPALLLAGDFIRAASLRKLAWVAAAGLSICCFVGGFAVVESLNAAPNDPPDEVAKAEAVLCLAPIKEERSTPKKLDQEVVDQFLKIGAAHGKLIPGDDNYLKLMLMNTNRNPYLGTEVSRLFRNSAKLDGLIFTPYPSEKKEDGRIADGFDLTFCKFEKDRILPAVSSPFGLRARTSEGKRLILDNLPEKSKTQLVWLDLTLSEWGKQRDDAAMLTDFKRVAEFKNLRTLHLSSMHPTRECMDELTVLKKLETLSLDSTDIDDQALKPLGKLNTLTTLDLLMCKVGDDGMREIAKLRRLRSLDISGAAVTDSGINELSSLKNLEYLNLAGVKINDSSVKTIAKLKTLKFLNLAGTNITDDGLKELCNLEELQKLHLWGTKVSDAGITSLKTLKNLSTLDIACTKTTDDALASVEEMKQLTRLYLYVATPGGDGAGFKPDSVRAFMESHPQCELLTNQRDLSRLPKGTIFPMIAPPPMRFPRP